MCGDSAAPNADNAHPCRIGVEMDPLPDGGFNGLGNGPTPGPNSCRETTFPNNVINRIDAQMPSALVRFAIQPGGSGYLHGADKNLIYTGNSNPFYATHIPAEPWISPINSDLQGYLWDSWLPPCPATPDSKTCQYDYWNDLADHGAEVVSCPGLDADTGPAGDCDGDGIADTGLGDCPSEPGTGTGTFQYIVQPGDTLQVIALQFGVDLEELADFNNLDPDAALVPGQIILIPGSEPGAAEGCLTGGFKWLRVYSDNHGEAMTWINGDADLTFDECLDSNTTLPTPVGGDSPADIKVIQGFFCRPGDVVGESTVIADVDYPDKRKHFPIQTNAVDITWTWGGEKTVEVEQSVGNQFTRVTFRATDRDGFCFPTPSNHPVIGELVTFLIDSGEGVIVGVSPGGSIGAGGQSATAPLILDPEGSGDCVAWVDILSTLVEEVNVFICAFDPEGTVCFDVIINRDTDDDDIPDDRDNCPTVPNTNQSNVDMDTLGDACDTEGPPGNDNGVGGADDCEDEVDNDGDGATDFQDSGCTTSPTPPPGTQEELWMDVDCSDLVSAVDALKVLIHDAGMDITQEEACPEMEENIDMIGQNGDHFDDELWGDANCQGEVNAVDSLAVLRWDAGLEVFGVEQPCPEISSEVDIPIQS